jgi:hypothetical protein
LTLLFSHIEKNFRIQVFWVVTLYHWGSSFWQFEGSWCPYLNPSRSYVGPRPTLWFSCSRRFSWSLTLSNPIFLPHTYSPALIYFGWERGWWVTCNYPTVLKEKNRNKKSTTCAIWWLKSVLHEEKRWEQENHNVGLCRIFK